MSRRVRLLLLLAGILAVVVTGTVVVIKVAANRVDDAIPQTDLFGDATPSPSASPTPVPVPSPTFGADIKGPLNILIVGVDTRVSVKDWQPHADAVMILHISKDLSSAYLTSLPRDLVVDVPKFAKAGFGGERTKLTHAMSYGSKVPGKSRANPAQGFQLVAATVSRYTGIARFDAGAVLTFAGYRRLIDAIGGVDLYVDQTTTSIHLNTAGQALSEKGGKAITYKTGTRHMNGWQALDYSRQRYLAGGDYTRQRHQRQLIKAMLGKIVSRDVWGNPAQLNTVLKRLGDTLVFDGRGHSVIDFAFALKNLRANKLTLVGLPGDGAYSGGSYIGENLGGVQSSYFAALRKDTLAAWVKAHPTLVNKK